MRVADIPVPGAAFGRYPQRRDVRPGWLERTHRALVAMDPDSDAKRRRARRAFVAKVHAAQARLPAPRSVEFAQAARETRAELGRRGFAEPALARAFALVRASCAHLIGIELYDSQITAARVMLDDRLAEMATGEGKTHAALLAAATAAMMGIPVHLITANDYLAARDAGELAPVFRFLGLSVGCVTAEMPDGERRDAYASDVCYCTAKDLIFDYLRDRTSGSGVADGELRARLRNQAFVDRRRPTLLRGLCLALIDEADSILLDEARTPFVLARSESDPAQALAHRFALDLARSLRPGFDFELRQAVRAAELNANGRRHIEMAAATLEGVWRTRRFREEVVEQALAALHLYRRDVDYVVSDGKVEIVDPNTGRVAKGRVWSRGLHQMIELKEGCEPTPAQRTVAQLTFQRFFPRYLKLGGMSGTLSEARGELLAVYGVDVEPVPLRTPSLRRHLPTRVFASARLRWRAVIESIRRHHAAGRPVLVGTDSVADSERLGRMLRRLRVEHRVLNAVQDAGEAELVAQAGEAGRVTVATNMAGRGTDIKLSAAAAAAGGLHVISCQHNASRRIDRQLHGRAARQGDPGSVETLLSLQEGLLLRHLSAKSRRLFTALAGPDRTLPGRLSRALVRHVQRVEERRARTDRARVMKNDEEMDRRLGIGGPGE